MPANTQHKWRCAQKRLELRLGCAFKYGFSDAIAMIVRDRDTNVRSQTAGR